MFEFADEKLVTFHAVGSNVKTSDLSSSTNIEVL